ncbi:MAG TPA: histidine kinase [Solirubrobacteraceae bacterium]|nr:histidine kinase [Solirubrobacteraceae bacterium]
MLALPPRLASLVRIAGLILIDWSVADSGHPPTTHDRGLVVSVLLALTTSSWLLWAVRSRHDRGLGLGPGRERAVGQLPRLELPVMAVAGGLLTAASPSSAASAFVFVAVVAGGLRMELSPAAALGVLGVLGLAIGTLLYGESALELLAYSLGLCAAVLAASNSRQSARRAEEAELVLVHMQRSHEEQLRSARLEESARIARDIHDVLAHTLAGLTIQLEATAALVEGGAGRDDVLGRIRRAHQLARKGLHDARRAVGALRGEGPTPLPQAIDALVADYRSSTNAPVALRITGDLARLGVRSSEAIIRVTQEALTNVQKHAPGAAVNVRLDAGESAARPCLLIVENQIPDPQWPGAGAGRRAWARELATAGGGFGIRGMRERAKELGGELSAGACPDGWRVELRLPPAALGAATGQPVASVSPAAPDHSAPV